MEMSRNRRLQLNTVTSLIFQITTILCGIILPRLILECYGSHINGLVNSISQFMMIIAFLDLGVGSVVQSSLYKPLAENDRIRTSQIIHSADRFFSRIAWILSAYIILLVILYPALVQTRYDFWFTAQLIFVMGIASFAQYYFGVVDRLLLSADQKGYIQYSVQTITLILNTIFCAVLIKFRVSIQIVKLTTSCIYLLRPIMMRIYIDKHYKLNRKILYVGEPISQKWNGIAQHVASVVLDGTDIIVLTLFSTLDNVSVYSVYFLVIHGIKDLFQSLKGGFQALMGEMLAKDELEELKMVFDWTEWLFHTGAVLVFGCTSVLIIPFVSVYTRGITDANYNVPVFAILITLAYACHCIRLPYNTLVLSAGHYRQTQWHYIVAMIINIGVSVLTVKAWGLPGVAVGTLCAMVFQMTWVARYGTRHILHCSLHGFVKHIAVDALMFITAFFLTRTIPMKHIDYFSWLWLALIVFFVWSLTIMGFNYFFYRKDLMRFLRGVARRIVRRT